MKLSEIDTAVYYPVEVPSTKKKTKFRPFLVKEERALLVARESEDGDTMLTTLEAIVRSCVQKLPEQLTTFDIEYLFVKIRAKSVGETAEMNGTCGSCGEKTRIQVDLTKIYVDTPKGHEPKIKLSDKIAVVMRYPSMDELANLMNIKDPTEQKMRGIAIMVESVYFEDKVFHTKESEVEEVIAFLDNRTDEEFAKIMQFMDTIPTVKLDVGFKCMHCGEQNKVVATGLKDFF